MGGNWCKHRHTNTQTETLALTPRANIARKCTVPFDVMACSVVEWHENRTNNNNNSNDARNIKPCPFTAKSQAFSHRISFFSVSVNVFVLQFLVSFFVWVDCGSVFNGHFCIHWIRINRIPNAGNYNAGRVLHIHQAIKISYNERPKENRRGRDREGWHTYMRYKLDIVQCAMPKININHVIFRVVYVRLVSVCATRPIDTMHALFFVINVLSCLSWRLEYHSYRWHRWRWNGLAINVSIWLAFSSLVFFFCNIKRQNIWLPDHWFVAKIWNQPMNESNF